MLIKKIKNIYEFLVYSGKYIDKEKQVINFTDKQSLTHLFEYKELYDIYISKIKQFISIGEAKMFEDLYVLSPKILSILLEKVNFIDKPYLGNLKFPTPYEIFQNLPAYEHLPVNFGMDYSVIKTFKEDHLKRVADFDKEYKKLQKEVFDIYKKIFYVKVQSRIEKFSKDNDLFMYFNFRAKLNP
jgi:hypothetical protein